MTDWDTIKCYECGGQCNSKGNPSVMKGSAYCEANRGTIPEFRISMWQRFRERVEMLGLMRKKEM